MQTFLPYKSYVKSAECLDNARLGKQRVEVKQIFRALTDPTYGWQHHPAVNMWRGHHKNLLRYGMIICQEWICRGCKDTLHDEFLEIFLMLPEVDIPPAWVGNNRFHRSHRSNLLRKFPEHYRQYFPKTPDNLPYIWPTTTNQSM